MARVFAPDPTFCGTCAGLEFTGGVAESGDLFLLGLLAGKGFAVDFGDIQPCAGKSIAEMSAAELAGYAHKHGISLSGIRQGDPKARGKIIERIEGDRHE